MLSCTVFACSNTTSTKLLTLWSFRIYKRTCSMRSYSAYLIIYIWIQNKHDTNKVGTVYGLSLICIVVQVYSIIDRVHQNTKLLMFTVENCLYQINHIGNISLMSKFDQNLIPSNLKCKCARSALDNEFVHIIQFPHYPTAAEFITTRFVVVHIIALYYYVHHIINHHNMNCDCVSFELSCKLKHKHLTIPQT